LNPDGSVDSTWPGYTNDKTECMLMQTNGKVVVGGYFSQVNGEPRSCLARFNADGSIDPTFVANADNYVWTVAPAGPGKILVSGGFSTIDGISRRGVARLNLPEGASGGVTTPPAPKILNAKVNGQFQCVVGSVSGFNYVLQYQAEINGTSWVSMPAVAGTGGPIALTDGRTSAPRFYRVQVQ